MRIARLRSADLSEYVFVAIEIDIGERDAVSFMHLSGPRRFRHIDKAIALLVEKQNVGQFGPVRRITRSQIDIRITIVIDIAKIDAHGHEEQIEFRLFRNITERSVA